MKRFLYLVQVEADLPDHLAPLAGPDSDICFLSWKSPSADKSSLFYPHSSWTQGRNRLLKEVIGTDYLYYIFIDDDVELRETNPGPARNLWRVFEEFLAEYEPAVGFPRYPWHLIGGLFEPAQRVQSLRFFDAIVNAFHREALLTLLPYYDLMDKQSECYSQNILCSLAASFYDGHLLQLNNLEVHNLKNRRIEGAIMLYEAEQLFVRSMRNERDRSSFLRQTVGGSARHATLGDPRRKSRSYEVPLETLERQFLTGHSLWVRKRQLLDWPKEHEFFSDHPETDRAREWHAEKLSRSMTPQGMTTRVKLASLGFRRKYGLTKGAAKAAARRYLTRAQLAPAARLLLNPVDRRIESKWIGWRASAGTFFEKESPSTITHWLAFALSRLAGDRLTVIDVGEHDDIVRLLRHRLLLHKSGLSIGVDPDLQRSRFYAGFVAAVISNEQDDDFGEGGVPRYRLSTLIRQFALEETVLHVVRIADRRSNAGAFRSLNEYSANCLFLQLTAASGPGRDEQSRGCGVTSETDADRHVVESHGFRLLSVARAGALAPSQSTFVNVQLFDRLFADVWRGAS